MSILLKQAKAKLKLGEIVCDSLELVEEINKIRKMETEHTGKRRAKLSHADFLKKIREYNDVAEILNEGIISLVKYKDTKGEFRPKANLTDTQAKVFLASESYFGKVVLSKYIDNLKLQLINAKESIEHTKDTHDKLYEHVKEQKQDKINQEYQRINKYINQTVCKKWELNQNSLSKDDMTPEQLEFRAEVEELWIKHYKGKKGGIKAIVESKLM